MKMTTNFDPVLLGAALQRVEREVEQDLDQIRPVRRHRNVLAQRVDEQLIIADGGMNSEQLAEVAQDLVGPNPRGAIGLLPQEAEIPPGDFDAIGNLPGNALEAILDHLQVFPIHARSVANSLINDLE